MMVVGNQGGPFKPNMEENKSDKIDPNEALLFAAMKGYDESNSWQQKFMCLQGSVAKLALTQTGSRFL
jgi:hypothetical protein